MRRRKSRKFIPTSDSEFALKARLFARAIARDPQRFMLTAEDADRIQRPVEAFRQALAAATSRSTRTPSAILKKQELRVPAERVMRAYGRIIRANPELRASDKLRGGVREPSPRSRQRALPKEPPMLMFIGSIDHPSLGRNRHVLRFAQEFGKPGRAKPAGAVRLELAVELVAPGEPIPRDPGELAGGRVWIWRSYTTTPIEVQFPVPAMPMMVVYWGRWADAKGEVGPWSATCPARVEGWSMGGALEDQRTRDGSPVYVSVRRSAKLLEQTNSQKLLEQTSLQKLLPSQQAIEELPEEVDGEVLSEQQIRDIKASTMKRLTAACRKRVPRAA